MPEFTTIQDAFQWWIDNIYPELAVEDKKTLRLSKSKFLKNRPLSGDKMLEIMEKYSQAQIKVILP
jgi:hypothetical protein